MLCLSDPMPVQVVMCLSSLMLLGVKLLCSNGTSRQEYKGSIKRSPSTEVNNSLLVCWIHTRLSWNQKWYVSILYHSALCNKTWHKCFLFYSVLRNQHADSGIFPVLGNIVCSTMYCWKWTFTEAQMLCWRKCRSVNCIVGGSLEPPPVHAHSHGSVTADQPISKGFFSCFCWLAQWSGS